jgi:hypothetical protein
MKKFVVAAILLLAISVVINLKQGSKQISRELNKVHISLTKSNLDMQREIKKQDLMLDVLLDIIPKEDILPKREEIDLWYLEELENIK